MKKKIIGVITVLSIITLTSACTNTEQKEKTSDKQEQKEQAEKLTIEGYESGDTLETDENGNLSLVGYFKPNKPIAVIITNSSNGKSTANWVKSGEDGKFTYNAQAVPQNESFKIQISSDAKVVDGNAQLNQNPKIDFEATLTNPTKNNDNMYNFKTSYSDDWHGLKTTIDSVQIKWVETPQKDVLGNPVQAIVKIDFNITNNSDRTMMDYPNQAKLIIGDKQYNADMANSTNDLGGEIVSGVTKNGGVLFNLPELTNPADIKNIRITWPATDTKVEDVNDWNKDYDVTLNLELNN